ncbi:MAG: hypothetical protein ACR2NZ_12210 [Rubripirellula sp.]
MPRIPLEAFIAASFLGIGVIIGVLSQGNPQADSTSVAQTASFDNVAVSHDGMLEAGIAYDTPSSDPNSASDLRSLQSNPFEVLPLEDSVDRSAVAESAEVSESAVVATSQPETSASNVIPKVDSEVSTDRQLVSARAAEPSAVESSTDVANRIRDAAPLAADLFGKPTTAKIAALQTALSLTPKASKPGPNEGTTASPLASMSQSNSAPATCDDGTCTETLESHGTTLKWAETPAAAYQMAGVQKKLVFLIHVSGNFEIPGFT